MVFDLDPVTNNYTFLQNSMFPNKKLFCFHSEFIIYELDNLAYNMFIS